MDAGERIAASMYMPRPLGAISLPGGEAVASFDNGNRRNGSIIYPGIISFVRVKFIFFLCGMDIAEAFSILKNVKNPDRKIVQVM